MAYKFTMGTAILSGALVPAVDDSYDLGTATAQWQDLYLDGRATIDALTLDATAVTATGAELNYLDITTLGTAAASKALVADGSAEIAAGAITWTNLGAVTTCDINGGAIDGAIIGAASAAAGTFTAVVGTTGTYSGVLKTDDATEATTTLDGSLQTDGGLSVAKSAVIGDDLDLLSNSAVVNIGSDQKFTMTHANANNTVTVTADHRLAFGDAGDYIAGDGTDLSIVSSGLVSVTGDTSIVGTLSADTSLTLDTTTITTAEIGVLDGVTAGTAAASKAVVLDASKNIATIGTVGCGAITSTGNSTFGQVSSSAGFISPLAQRSSLGKLDVKGNLHVSGSTVLGNASADTVDSLGAVLGLPNLNATTGSTVKMLAYTATGNLETRTRAQFVADIAGTGLSTSGGKLVLSADTTTVTAFGNTNATLVEGFNYASATLTAARTLTLPASAGMAVGDVVQVKVAALASGIRAIIARAGSQTIDGANEIYLDSSYGAVSLKYVAADTWRIF